MITIYLENLNIEIAEEDILRLLGYNETDIVYVAGSLIEKIGNKSSDLDIFILSDDIVHYEEDKMDYDFEQCKVKFIQSYGINFDIEIWPKSILLEIIQAINSISFAEGSRTLNLLKLPTNCTFDTMTSLIHRFITGYCLHNGPEYKNLLEKLNLKNYYRIVTRKSVNSIDNSIDDLIGNIEKGDYHNSVIIGRNLLLNGIKSYLFSREISVDRNKWIYPKLRLLAENDIFAEKLMRKFERYYFSNITDEKSLKKNAHDILNFINDLLSEINI